MNNCRTDLDVIRCIFYSEFHPTAGPMLVYQVPDDFIGKEEFDLMNMLIITKSQLHNHIVANNFLDHKVVGCPIHISLDYMARNVLIFNLCFVFDATVKTARYELVLKKVANYLKILELECQFISNSEVKRRMPTILSQMLHDLNNYGECHIPVTSLTTLHLQVPCKLHDCLTVHDHEVPVLINAACLDFSQLDVSTRQLVELIDGYRHVASIAQVANGDVDVIKSRVANLVQWCCEISSHISVFTRVRNNTVHSTVLT